MILCRSQEEAQATLARVKAWVEENGLTLHPEKTRVIDAALPGGFDFLGYHFERSYRWPRRKALAGLKDKVRALTPRTSGDSLEYTAEQLSQLLRGWFAYFKHSHRATFAPLDGFVRNRLRAILRKRSGGKGRARGSDFLRWPNHYFDKLGLFNLTAAHALACQSQ